jgi:hypothetical protein
MEDFDAMVDNSLLSLANTHLSMPEIATDTSVPDTSLGSSILDGLDSLGGLKGLGSLAGTIGNIWGGIEQRKYQKDLLKMEKERIARDRARQDKFDSGMQKAWA